MSRRAGPLPPLSVEAFAALKASSAEHGVLQPIVVSAGPALPGALADGEQRLRACRELALDCPQSKRRFASEAELRVYQLVANLQRRQLSDLERIRLGLALEPWERRLAAERR